MKKGYVPCMPINNSLTLAKDGKNLGTAKSIGKDGKAVGGLTMNSKGKK